MTLEIEVVGRDEIMTIFCLERSFVERWKEPQGDIPAMPRMNTNSRKERYHIPSVRQWLKDYHQTGGK